mmetsp:Transcript_19650/g.39077  ORF Transcript_19650/g.39077 Transcript_19650/m.39077 type:complete len:203 (+) Transcript_19650:225-833(+)
MRRNNPHEIPPFRDPVDPILHLPWIVCVQQRPNDRRYEQPVGKGFKVVVPAWRPRYGSQGSGGIDFLVLREEVGHEQRRFLPSDRAGLLCVKWRRVGGGAFRDKQESVDVVQWGGVDGDPTDSVRHYERARGHVKESRLVKCRRDSTDVKGPRGECLILDLVCPGGLIGRRVPVGCAEDAVDVTTPDSFIGNAPDGKAELSR